MRNLQELFIGRGDGTRTNDLCVPNAALYQTEPHLGREEMLGKLDDIMRDAPTERDREAIRKCMGIMRDA